MLSFFTVIFDASFFPTLGHFCPKLKELWLDNVNVLGALIGYTIIDMQDLRLQRLSLTTPFYFRTNGPWLIVVKTHKEYVYIKLIKWRIYKILTYEEATEEIRGGRFNSRCCISCFDIEELVFNDEKITLYSDSTTSDIVSNDKD